MDFSVMDGGDDESPPRDEDGERGSRPSIYALACADRYRKPASAIRDLIYRSVEATERHARSTNGIWVPEEFVAGLLDAVEAAIVMEGRCEYLEGEVEAERESRRKRWDNMLEGLVKGHIVHDYKKMAEDARDSG